MTKPKAKNKNFCSKCFEKHAPPTGQKCTQGQDGQTKDSTVPKKKIVKKHNPNVISSSDNDSVSDSFSSDEVTKQSDCSANRGVAPGKHRPSDHPKSRKQGSSSEEEDTTTTDTQALILQELRRVNSRLDAVEERVATTADSTKQGRLKLSKTSSSSDNIMRKCSCKVSKTVSTSSSEDEDLPCLSTIRSSCHIQKKNDKRIE